MSLVADIAGPSVLRLLDEARIAGVALDEVPRWLALPLEALSDPDIRVPLDRYLDLAAHLAERTGDPDLPFRAVRHNGPARFHVLGFLAMTQPDVRSALQAVCDHLRVWIRGARLECGGQDGDLHAVVRADPELVPARRELLEGLVMASIVAHLDQLASEPLALALVVPAGLEARVVPRQTRHTVGAGSPTTIQVPEEQAALPLKLAQPEMASFFEDFIDQQLDERSEQELILSRVRACIAERLPHGDIHQAAIAQALSLSARSLQRYLEEQGTSYQEQLDEVRRRLAIRHLATQPALPIDTVSWLVGYNDTASFRRAFRRWMGGQSPAAYRQTL